MTALTIFLATILRILAGDPSVYLETKHQEALTAGIVHSFPLAENKVVCDSDHTIEMDKKEKMYNTSTCKTMSYFMGNQKGYQIVTFTYISSNGSMGHLGPYVLATGDAVKFIAPEPYEISVITFQDYK